jgi:hypothetical protein
VPYKLIDKISITINFPANQQKSFLEGNTRTATQKVPCLLWKLKVHYHVHKILPLFPILCRAYLVHSLPLFLNKPFQYCIQCIPQLPSIIFPSDFMTNIFYEFLICLMHATYSAQLSLLILSSSLYLVQIINLLNEQSSPASCHFFPLNAKYILLRTLFSNTLYLHYSLNVRNQDSHPYKTPSKILVISYNSYISR